jgi:WhiB family redox-sensing transcriptional regulator
MAGRGRLPGHGIGRVLLAPGERGHHRRNREQRAMEVCRACPVLDDCAAFALSTRQPYGIWGGLTERQRDTPHPASRAA